MQLKYRVPFVLFAVLALTVCRVPAQEDDEDEEEFGTMGFYAKSNQAMKVDLRLTQGAQVNFGNLGNVPVPVSNSPYMDGSVSKDQLRAYNSVNPPISETDSESHRLYPSGGRYKTYSTPGDTTSSVVTDYLGYEAGITRYWQYSNASQADRTGHVGYIAFDNYSAVSDGQSATGSRGYTGGVELSVSRNITNPSKRVSLSLVAGVSISGINSSTSGTVSSTLHTVSDYYQYHPYTGTAAPAFPAVDGVVPSPIYSGPSFDSTTISGRTTETTTTLDDTADVVNESTDKIGAAQVKGNWKIRGAYFTFKVGPQVLAMVTRSIGLSASIGLAGSYVGTSYTATESFSVTGVPDISTDLETSTKDKFLPGYYANIDATWTLNERTGMFAGFSYENLGDYTQGLGGRTAKIDLSGTAGVRGGLSIKF